MTTYTVHPTTYVVEEEGVGPVGSAYPASTEAIQAAIDLAQPGDTVRLLAGIHNMSSLRPAGTRLDVSLVSGETIEHYEDGDIAWLTSTKDENNNHIPGIAFDYLSLSLNKAITLEGELGPNGEKLTTLKLSTPAGGYPGNNAHIVVHGGLRDGSTKPTVQQLRFEDFMFPFYLYAPVDVLDFEMVRSANLAWHDIDNRLIYPNLEQVNGVWNGDLSHPNKWTVSGGKFIDCMQLMVNPGISGLTFKDNEVYGLWPVERESNLPPGNLLTVFAVDYNIWNSFRRFPFPWTIVMSYGSDNTFCDNKFYGHNEAGQLSPVLLGEYINLFPLLFGTSSNNVVDNNVFDGIRSWGFGTMVHAGCILATAKKNSITRNKLKRVSGGISAHGGDALSYTGLLISKNSYEDMLQTDPASGVWATPGIRLLSEVSVSNPTSTNISDFVISDNDYTLAGFSEAPVFGWAADEGSTHTAIDISNAVDGRIVEAPSSFPVPKSIEKFIMLSDLSAESCLVLPNNPPLPLVPAQALPQNKKVWIRDPVDGSNIRLREDTNY